jgi:glycosyltransferase involved in cell wall biosynthesis
MTSVLMTADAVGGVWTYSLELAAALARRDVHVTLAVMGPAPSADKRRAASAAGVLAVHAHPYALEWMDDPWSDVDAATEWLMSLERDVHPDIVHLNGFSHAVAPWTSPVVVVAHSDVVSWWNEVHRQAPGDEWAEYIARVRAGLAAADAVVAPTAAAATATAAAYGRRPAVIPNGRSRDWVVAAPKEPIILGVGRIWDPAKNVDALGRVAERLEWPVLVAGDDTAPDGTPQRLAGPLQPLGPLPFAELARWFGRAAVFASPARYEPFGLGALEAGLSGCALVLGDIPSLREVWGDAAVFVAPDDDDELCRTLEQLIRHPGRCVELGARARARAATYTPESSANAYAELYHDLVGAARRRPDATTVGR